MSGLYPHHGDGEGSLARITITGVEDGEGFHQPQVRPWTPIDGIVELQTEGVDAYLEGERALSELRFEDYTMWTQTSWKEEHLTLEAKERFISKLYEELHEVMVEYRNLQTSPEDPDVKAAFVDELGDYLWSLSACAALLRIDTQRAVTHSLVDLKGEGSLFHTIGDIDEMVESGIRPILLENLYNEEDGEYELNPVAALPLLTQSIASTVQQYYGDEDVELLTQPPVPFAEDLDAGYQYGKAVYFVAYYAHHYADSSLEQVIAGNIEKITGRVAEGLVDKSDGVRD